jgi:hypothetical protein
MSRRKVTIFVAVAVTVAIVAVALSAQERQRPLSAVLGESQYVNCGLEKLNESELHHVRGLMLNAPLPSYMEQAAARYLENEGWEEVRIVGALRKGSSSDDKYILAAREYELIVLDPSIVPYLPEPGYYWADISGSYWTVLFPNGETGGFWERNLE